MVKREKNGRKEDLKLMQNGRKNERDMVAKWT